MKTDVTGAATHLLFTVTPVNTQEPLPSDEASAESGAPTETLEINIVFLKT